MSIFVSYARLDEGVVKTLVQGLEWANREIWFDNDLIGAEVWWVKILENIRQAEVVIFALSDNALQSKPCRAELDYAIALERNVLPIKVGPVQNFRANPLSALQSIDWRPDDANLAFRIIAAIDQAAKRVKPLPEVLPPEPLMPYAYLISLRSQIESGELSPRAQLEAVDELRKAYRDETDPGVDDDILSMLRGLKAKPWATVQTASEVDAALAWAESLRQATSAGARPAAVPVPGETVEQAERSTKSAEETERERRQEFERNVAEALLRQEQEGGRSAPPGSDQRGSGRSEPPEPIKVFRGASTPIVGQRVTDASPVIVDDNVQFTVYRPNVVQPARWYPMLAFAHIAERRPETPLATPDPLEQVKALAARALGEDPTGYGTPRADARSGVPREGLLTFVPEVDGIEFNPRSVSFEWREDVHQQNFRLYAPGNRVGTVCRGQLTVFLGAFLLADVDLAIRVAMTPPPPPAPMGLAMTSAAARKAPSTSRPATSDIGVVTAHPYRKIFPSYSHKDLAIVHQAEVYGRALGDVYLRDRLALRSGEQWDERLLELIDEADVFQLFWSHNSMNSPYVRREWEHAIGLGRPSFVRPTYWEVPMPRSSRPQLPPNDLDKLHFHGFAEEQGSGWDDSDGWEAPTKVGQTGFELPPRHAATSSEAYAGRQALPAPTPSAPLVASQPAGGRPWLIGCTAVALLAIVVLVVTLFLLRS